MPISASLYHRPYREKKMEKKMSFLIVDDSAAMRRVIRRILAEYGGRIIECDNGGGAFSAYEKNKPDWILMDIEMAEKDGLTATREICEAFPGARVVIVSKHGDEAMRRAAKEAGACGYVVKEDLLQLREILGAVPGI